jgi:hypothetical protein
MTRTKPQTYSSNGIAIQAAGARTDLGLAMLIAEDEEGNHEPVAVTSTIREAKELAASDFCDRMDRLERGDNPGIFPYIYKLWARAINGDYRIAYEIQTSGSSNVRDFQCRFIIAADDSPHQPLLHDLRAR